MADRTSVKAGASFSASISGSNLTGQTYFDVRLTSPGGNADVVLNWQSAASGIWTITGVRPHEIETDHTGSFFPVSATVTVSP
jgi:hypothetical protein